LDEYIEHHGLDGDTTTTGFFYLSLVSDLFRTCEGFTGLIIQL